MYFISNENVKVEITCPICGSSSTPENQEHTEFVCLRNEHYFEVSEYEQECLLEEAEEEYELECLLASSEEELRPLFRKITI